MQHSMENTMQDKSQVPVKLMILISLVQGFILLLLHQSIDLDFWPNNSPEWLFSFYSMAFIGPTMLLLGLRKGQVAATVKWVLPFTLLGGVLGYYTGDQAIPLQHIRYDGLFFSFTITMLIATFKAMIYVQQFNSGEKFNYSLLFGWSWRNFLTLSLSLLFAACFWGILMLWGGLFKSININFFMDLFTEKWFFYPTISLANGFGIIIFRNLSNVIDTITRLQQALMKFLLVVLVLVSILFLGTLPITGLNPLWESGGSSLILWMQALMLFFVNAVYQDEPKARPYQLYLHRFIYLGVFLLPIYSAISFYGLSLRVDQYGWSLLRCWAFLIWFLLALFPIGYVWGIIKMRDNWLYHLSRVNVLIGLVVLAAMLLVNSPLLDFRKIVVNSQINEINSKGLAIDDMDVDYFRKNLAKPGYIALQELQMLHASANPSFVFRVNKVYANHKTKENLITKHDFLAAIHVLNGDIPDSLADFLYKKNIAKNNYQSTKKYYLNAINLDDVEPLEYLLVEERQSSSYLYLYVFEEGHWLNVSTGQLGKYHKLDDEFLEQFINGNIELQKPKWPEIKIGDHQFQVR